MRFRPLLLLPLSLLFSACASFQQGGGVPVASAVAQSQEETEVRDEGWLPGELPKAELSGDLLMRFLVGDIALQRGQPALAARAWVDLARKTRDPRIARRALELAVATGQLAQAQEMAQIWTEVAPSSAVARQLALSLAIRANKLAEAEVLVAPFLKNPPRNLAGFYMQLHLWWDRSAKPQDVARLTSRLTAGQDAMPEAHFARAVVHAMQARPAAALAELDAALELRAWWDSAVLYKAQILVQNNRADEAVAYLHQAVEAAPKQLAFRQMLARTLVELKRPGEARGVYQDILKISPANLQALQGAGLLALQEYDTDAAYSLLSAALEREPANADQLRIYLGQIEEERYRFREALAHYQQVSGEEEKKQAAKRIPRLLARLGERDAAFKAVTALPEGDAAEKVEKVQIEAQVWRELKSPAQGRAVLGRMLQQQPDSVDLLYDRALLADQMEDVAAAEQDLRRVLQLQPDHVQALNALGYVLVSRTKRLAEAEALLQRAFKADPENPVIIDSIGWLRFRQGELDEALVLLGRAYGKLHDPEVAAHYAEALWRSGNIKKAREILAAGQKLDPEHPAIIETRKRLGF